MVRTKNRIEWLHSNATHYNMITFYLICMVLSFVHVSVRADSNMEPKVREISGLNGIVAAYGDFNSDKFTDLFLITDNGMCFSISRQIPDQTESDAQVSSALEFILNTVFAANLLINVFFLFLFTLVCRYFQRVRICVPVSTQKQPQLLDSSRVISTAMP